MNPGLNLDDEPNQSSIHTCPNDEIQKSPDRSHLKEIVPDYPMCNNVPTKLTLNYFTSVIFLLAVYSPAWIL